MTSLDMTDFPLKLLDIALCFYESKLKSEKKRGYKLFQLLVNRAAMGRTRFLLYRYFIFINRAAMGRTRFLLYRYFIYFFLTARPWAERGSCSTATLFIYLFLSVTRPKLPLGQIVSVTSNHATDDVYSP